MKVTVTNVLWKQKEDGTFKILLKIHCSRVFFRIITRCHEITRMLDLNHITLYFNIFPTFQNHHCSIMQLLSNACILSFIFTYKMAIC